MSSITYQKTFEDEVDWKLFDQLHGAVAQISGFCFETKKFCVTTEFVVLTLFVKFTDDKLDHALFATGLIIPVCFWFLDAVAYYYQVKLRGIMESIRLKLVARNSPQLVSPSSTPIISHSRTERPLASRVFRAAINHSMWLYALMIVVDVVLWLSYCSGVFG
jgi:hypothetical protein